MKLVLIAWELNNVHVKSYLQSSTEQGNAEINCANLVFMIMCFGKSELQGISVKNTGRS